MTAKRTRSSITGRFVRAITGRRHPRETVAEDAGRARVDEVRRRRPAVRVDARVPRALFRGRAAEGALAMPGLELVDLDPPGGAFVGGHVLDAIVAGDAREVELTFATAPGCGPVDEDLVRSELQRVGLPVLVTRTRGGEAA